MHHSIVSAGKRVDFVSVRKIYTMLRVHCCNIIVINAHAPIKEKSDVSNGGSYEEKGQVFDHFSKNRMKMVLYFNARLGRENIFKPTIRNEILHQDSNDNCVRMRWGGHVAHMGEETWVYMVLVGKPGGKRPLGRPRRR